MKRFAKLSLTFLAPALLVASLTLAKESEKPGDTPTKGAISSPDSEGGFGRPWRVTGTILMVKPDQGMVALALRGASQAPSTDIIVHTKTVHNGDAAIREEEMTAAPAPGETDFNFRVTSSTLIKVDGQRVALSALATLKGRVATVRFVPRRAGNFALGIEVG
jgi:hypothetical protein